MPARNLLMVLLLVAAALSSWWLYQQVQPSEPVRSPLAAHEPDYFFEDFVLTSMNAEGKPKHKLSGSRMVHFPDDDTTEIDQPELEIYINLIPTWKIVANHGWISSGGDEVRLDGNVRIQRYGLQEEDAIHVVTEVMLVKPDQEYAETDHQVVVTGRSMQIQAVGMRVYLDEGRVELLSQVKGVYDPN